VRQRIVEKWFAKPYSSFCKIIYQFWFCCVAYFVAMKLLITKNDDAKYEDVMNKWWCWKWWMCFYCCRLTRILLLQELLKILKKYWTDEYLLMKKEIWWLHPTWWPLLISKTRLLRKQLHVVFIEFYSFP